MVAARGWQGVERSTLVFLRSRGSITMAPTEESCLVEKPRPCYCNRRSPVHAEPAEQPGYMSLDCTVGDVESARDFLIG